MLVKSVFYVLNLEIVLDSFVWCTKFLYLGGILETILRKEIKVFILKIKENMLGVWIAFWRSGNCASM